MDFLDLAKERYSVRKFTDKKVEKEKLDKILEAGRVAPTAVNFQPQRVLVIDDTKALEKLKSATPYHFNAPLAVLVCYDTSASWKRSYDNMDHGSVDASIVSTFMSLKIHSLGLGTTIVAHFDPKIISEVFELPEYLVPVILLPIGYPSDESTPHPFHSAILDEKDTVFYNTFDGIVKKNMDLKHK